AEVLSTQPEQRGAVELGVAPDPVVGVGMERLALRRPPYLLGAVLALEVDRPRAPVVLLAGDVVAPLEEQDALAGRRQAVGRCAPAGAGADDDHVEAARLVHDASHRGDGLGVTWVV